MRNFQNILQEKNWVEDVMRFMSSEWQYKKNFNEFESRNVRKKIWSKDNFYDCAVFAIAIESLLNNKQRNRMLSNS